MPKSTPCDRGKATRAWRSMRSHTSCSLTEESKGLSLRDGCWLSSGEPLNPQLARNQALGAPASLPAISQPTATKDVGPPSAVSTLRDPLSEATLPEIRAAVEDGLL